MQTWLKKLIRIILVFLILSILSYFVTPWLNINVNMYSLALSIGLFLTIVFIIFNYFSKEKEIVPGYNGKTAIRYTMYCNNCGWEWISNTTENEIKPSVCPNCREKGKLELIGWRKVSLFPKKINKDLRKFFK